MNHKSAIYSYFLKKMLKRAVIYELYINRKWSREKIAHYFSCSVFPIYKAMKKYNIKARKTGITARKYEKILTREVLIKEYIKNKLSLKEIANKYKIKSSKIIWVYCNIHKIKRRTIAEGTRIRLNKPDMKLKFSKSRKGKLHWNFKNWSSRKNYSIKWSKELKDSIRKRDDYKCQNCNKKQFFPGLDVHHIDYDKKNCKKII